MDPEERKRSYSGVMKGAVLAGARTSEGRRTIPLSGLPVCRDGAGKAVGVRAGAAGSGAHRFPPVPWRRWAFNTEETEDPRSSTEKGSIALRAKRLELPDAANGAPGLLSPETSVELRGFSVSSVLKMRRQTRPGPIRITAGPSTGSLQRSMAPNPFLHAACAALSAISSANGTSVPPHHDTRRPRPIRDDRIMTWQPNSPRSVCRDCAHLNERQRPCGRW
jgi:hypothetical protein